MVQLVSAGVVQVFALHIELGTGTNFIRKSCEMGNGSRPPLEFLADAAQLADELAGLADSLVGSVDLVHRRLQLGRDIRATVFANSQFPFVFPEYRLGSANVDLFIRGHKTRLHPIRMEPCNLLEFAQSYHIVLSF